MIDDRTRMMMEIYLPHPRDTSLELGEYYWQSGSGKVYRVAVLTILPTKDGYEYGIYREVGGRMQHVDVGYGDDPHRGVSKAELYDNQQDCRDRTHSIFDGWEALREQQEEAMRDGLL